MVALDEYLLSRGAEPVPESEWPEGCVGAGFRPDRVPFHIDDWPAADAAMKEKGYAGVLDFTAAAVL